MIPSVYFDMAIEAFRLYGSELIGAFLLGTFINLPYVKRTLKESFSFLSAGFYALVVRDVVLITLMFWPVVLPTYPLPEQTVEWAMLGMTGIVAALFVVGAFKNLRLYFSAVFLIPVLAILLGGFGIGLSVLALPPEFIAQLPLMYLAVSLLLVGISFYAAPTTREGDTIRGMGTGFVVLGICYVYLLIQLIPSVDMITILGCYTVTMLLSMATQVRFFNGRVARLEMALLRESNTRRELWDISPFPIIISRVRDDTVLYLNPAAQQAFQLRKGEIFAYRLVDYFVHAEKRQEMTAKMRSERVLSSFEVQMHHPKRDEVLWMDIASRPIELDEEVALYSTFKDITERRRVAELLQRQASTDPLTGLNNRRQFEVMTHQLLRVAERYGSPYSVAMIDIDSFKKFNDTYGHDVGDQVLVALAQTLKQTTRQSDVVARFGGEEFVIFFAQTSPEDGKIAAEHVRKAVENMPVEVNGKRIPVTISLGISGRGATTLETLIKQADVALYHSKHNGKNQVSLYDQVVASEKGSDDAAEDGQALAAVSDTVDVTVKDEKQDVAPVVSEASKAVGVHGKKGVS